MVGNGLTVHDCVCILDAGKTSLKKTLSGEPYDPAEKPSVGMNADPSVTRVTFKQFKEWVQQPTSKADTLRLNLEYIDVIIDYILHFVRRPQVGGAGGHGLGWSLWVECNL